MRNQGQLGDVYNSASPISSARAIAATVKNPGSHVPARSIARIVLEANPVSRPSLSRLQPRSSRA